jgi:Protein of unknown function (DUF1488)
MPLTRGRLIGYEFDRMVMLFSMVDGQREIPCAISTSAMDDLESLARSKPDQREAQFMRLRDRIEERAARKFLAMEFEGTPPSYLAQYRLQNIVYGQSTIRNSIGNACACEQIRSSDVFWGKLHRAGIVARHVTVGAVMKITIIAR